MTDEEQELAQRLEAAHAELVAARKIAGLSSHPSYKEIGIAINSVERVIMMTDQPAESIPHTAP